MGRSTGIAEVQSDKGLVRLAQLSIPLGAIQDYIGHEEAMPQRGECRHGEVLGDRQ